jgi:putative membrane protein
MSVAAAIGVGIIAALHLYFLVLEMFLWTTPRGRKTFGTSPEEAETTKVLAANQGLYNGFLAAGLVWSLVSGSGDARFQFQVFFLLCVIAAGIYGAATVSKRILVVQAVPAVVTLVLVLLAH